MLWGNQNKNHHINNKMHKLKRYKQFNDSASWMKWHLLWFESQSRGYTWDYSTLIDKIKEKSTNGVVVGILPRLRVPNEKDGTNDKWQGQNFM